MTVKISPLAHIEVVVRDAEKAYRFPLDWKTMPGFAESADTIDKDKHSANMPGGEEKVGFRFELTEILQRQGQFPSVSV